MAANRRKQSAAIRFGPAFKAAFFCLIIGGSAFGYVWQKKQIYQLSLDIRQRETHLARMRSENQQLRDRLTMLLSPVTLDQWARKSNLGPIQPYQVRRLPEPTVAEPGPGNAARQFAARQDHAPPAQ